MKKLLSHERIIFYGHNDKTFAVTMLIVGTAYEIKDDINTQVRRCKISKRISLQWHKRLVSKFPDHGETKRKHQELVFEQPESYMKSENDKKLDYLNVRTHQSKAGQEYISNVDR